MHLKQSGISIKTASIEDAVLPLVKLSKLLLQIFMNILQADMGQLSLH